MKQQQNQTKIQTTPRYLQATAITPSDDAYHWNINIFDIEWWYFDAMISNGYSIHIGFRTYHIRNSGVLQSRITLYKNGKTELERVHIHLFRNVEFSSAAPDITIDGTPVLRFDMNHYQATGTWIYHINLTIKDVQANLTFIGTTPGWKIETSTTSWTTPLPKATVEGTLTLKGKNDDDRGTRVS